MSLPYFEGDFWPNIIEDCIRDAEKEEHERKRHEELQVDDDEEETEIEDNRLKKNNKTSNSKKKNNLKKSSQKSKKKGTAGTGNQITDKLFIHLEKHKEVVSRGTQICVRISFFLCANNAKICCHLVLYDTTRPTGGGGSHIEQTGGRSGSVEQLRFDGRPRHVFDESARRSLGVFVVATRQMEHNELLLRVAQRRHRKQGHLHV